MLRLRGDWDWFDGGVCFIKKPHANIAMGSKPKWDVLKYVSRHNMFRLATENEYKDL